MEAQWKKYNPEAEAKEFQSKREVCWPYFQSVYNNTLFKRITLQIL